MSTCSNSSRSVSKSNPLSILEAAKRYAKLHHKICGAPSDSADICSATLSNVSMPKITNPKYINMSLLAFIRKYHLEALLPLFARSHAMLDTLPALSALPAFYGLYWNDADCFVRMLEGDKQGLWMLDGNLNVLLRAMAQRERLKVLKNVSVTSLNRYLNDEKHKICIMYDIDEKEKLIECDAVFCADDLATILPAVSDVTDEEEKALGQRTEVQSLVVTLFECAVNFKRESEDGNEEKVDEEEETDDDESDDEEEEDEVMDPLRARLVRVRSVSRMQYGAKGNGTEEEMERLVAYQSVGVGVGSVDEEAVEAALVSDLRSMGKERVRVVRQRVRGVSGRWTAAQIQNEMPWMAAQELQGKYKNCYYIGPSVSFDATEAVLEFNHQLMRNTLYL